MPGRAETVDRIWERDPTVWTGADEAKWLGWLDEPRRMRERVGELRAFTDGVAADGLDTVVLLGMGGSSLAPEVLRRTFSARALHVLDTTHPTAIRAFQDHGEVRGDTVREDVKEAHELIDKLRDLGVDYDDVTETLELEGVQKFADSFAELLAGVRSKRGQLAAV